MVRYAPSDLLAACPPLSETHAPLAGDASAPPLIISPGRCPRPALLKQLLLDTHFKATWERRRPDLSDQSQSGFDMSIVVHVLRAGGSDQDAVDAAIAHRAQAGEGPKRLDYYRRTLAKAHAERAAPGLQQPLPMADATALVDSAPTDAGTSEAQKQIGAVLAEISRQPATAHQTLLSRLKNRTGVPLRDLREALKRQAREHRAERRQRAAVERQAACFYRATSMGLVYDKPTNNGAVEVPLSNFTAKIVRVVRRSDGHDEELLYDLEARVEGKPRRLTIPAQAFAGMAWVPEHLGPSAIIYAGFNTKDHVRVAIQDLSDEIAQATVFSHLGWRFRDGRGWYYLHAGGGIGPHGPEGPETGLEVSLYGALTNYELPAPSTGARLVADIRAALRMLDVAVPHLAVPLFAAVFRATLGACDFSLFLAGPTGVFKTACAACAQAFWGKTFDDRHLPASWGSTGNALELIANLTKDAVLVVDDFAPTGSKVSVQQLHAIADRVLRGQGNRQGRARLTYDIRLRSERPPRGLVLATGEDIPIGQSLRARMIILEFGPGDVDVAVLTECQKAAREGVFARVLAAFVQFVARRHDAVIQALADRVLVLRDEFRNSQQHKRLPTLVADLVAGLEVFYDFASDAGAVSTEDVAKRLAAARAALVEAAAQQGAHQQHAEPTEVFEELLRAAVASGEAHVATLDGSVPAGYPLGLIGWETSGSAGNEYSRSHGVRIGWIEEPHLYLDLTAAYKAAQKMAVDVGGLSIGRRTLAKRLAEKGYLVTEGTSRGKHTVRVRVEGASKEVLHLRSSILVDRASQAMQAAPPLGGPPTRPSWPDRGGPEEPPPPSAGPTPSGPRLAQQQDDFALGPGGPDGPEPEGEAGCGCS